MLLEALVACAGVTLKAVATALDIPVRGGTVFAEGDLDFRGTLAISKDVPVGFREIRLRFELDTDATEEQLATLLKLTERYCVIYQTLRNPPAATAEIAREGGDRLSSSGRERFRGRASPAYGKAGFPTAIGRLTPPAVSYTDVSDPRPILPFFRDSLLDEPSPHALYP